VQGFWWESPKERDHFEDQGIDGRMGLERILGRFAEGIEWVQLAQDRCQWWSLVNLVLNLRFLALCS
jgi:hypothetical protein